MKLIVDSGSTKTEWVVLDKGQIVESFITKGFNPYYTTPEKIKALISSEVPDASIFPKIKQVYFFGTGCSTEVNCRLVQSILSSFFSEAAISTYHDLQGAAVALLKNKKGIACILGTGSNSCLWDGTRIVENVPSLGYWLGDEGSAVYLGKLLLKKILEGKAGQEISKTFYEYVGMDFTEVMQKLYKGPDTHRWVGGLSHFVTENIQNLQIKELAKKNFQDFIDNQVSEYSGYREIEISFLGSVAYYLQDILKEVMEESGLKTGVIMQSPMEGLIDFYRDK